MPTGTVKFFNEAKGFGFIKSNDEPAKEYFVHATGLKEKVKENDKVSFEIADGTKGPMAVNVTKIS
jgi:CspA family cold shock protein